MKAECPQCGRKVFVEYREKQKNDRYEGFETLLNEAIQAGNKAAEDYLPGYPGNCGKVWISLDDGRTSFARFLSERHPGMFSRPSLRRPPCYPVDIDDYHAAIAYANAFRVVLDKGGVKVSVHASPITREN